MRFLKYFKSKTFRKFAPKLALVSGIAIFGICMFSDVAGSFRDVKLSDVIGEEPLQQAKDGADLAQQAVSAVGDEVGADKIIDRAKKDLESDDNWDDSWYEENLSDNNEDEIFQTAQVSETDASSSVVSNGINMLDLQECLVVRVVDGDTYILDIEGTETKVRLIGVDTPESVAPESYRKENTHEGMTVSDIVKDKLVKDTLLYLEYDVSLTDKYGRTLAYVYFEDGTMVQDWLLKEGLANVATYPPNVKYAEHFAELAHKAAESKTGLWDSFFTEDR